MTTPLQHLPDAPPFVSEEASLVVLDQVLRRVRLEDAFGSKAKQERLWKSLVRGRSTAALPC